MVITEQQINEYKTNGFIILKGMFDTDTVKQIHYDTRYVFALQFEETLNIPVEKSINLSENEFSELMFELYKKHFKVFSNCSRQVQHLVSLHKLGVSEELIETLKGLGLTQPIISVRPSMLMNSIYMDKGGESGKYWRLPPHQDWYFNQGSIDSVTVWFPYVNVSQELGPLEFIPGSHLRGLQKSGEGDGFGDMTENFSDEDFVSFELSPGDAIVFFSLLVHRSGVNKTDRVRWSSQFRFNNLVEPKFIERNLPNPFMYYAVRELETPNFPSASDVENLLSLDKK